MAEEIQSTESAEVGPVESQAQVPAVFDRPKPLMLMIMLGVGLVALLAFAVLGYQTFSDRLEAARRLDNARALVEQADEIVVSVDQVVRAKVEPQLASEATSALADVEKADGKLEQALALVDLAYPKLNDDEQEQANLLRTSAKTRREMLLYAPAILEANAQAASALTPSADGWKALLAADKLSDQAVKAYNRLKKSGVLESQKLNRQAAEKLSESNKLFQSSEEAFSAAQFEDYLDYLSTRIKLNKLSQQSDKAWLAGDLVKANRIIKDYNKLDAKAVAQAAKLPATPDAMVATAYGEVTKTLTEQYYNARDLALEADKALREF